MTSCGFRWTSSSRLPASPGLRMPRRSAIAFALRSGVAPERGRKALRRHDRSIFTAADIGDTPLLDPDLSLVEFNSRVLALAEDQRTPVLERLGFIAIVSANLDEFFMVNVGGLKLEGNEGRLEAVALRLDRC